MSAYANLDYAPSGKPDPLLSDRVHGLCASSVIALEQLGHIEERLFGSQAGNVNSIQAPTPTPKPVGMIYNVDAAELHLMELNALIGRIAMRL